MAYGAQFAVCQCAKNSSVIVSNYTALYDEEHITNYGSLSAGSSLMISTAMVCLLMEIYVLKLALANQMWRNNSFLMWFISQGSVECITILIHVYSAVITLFPNLFNCNISIFFGIFVETAYHISLPHYVALALVRYLSIRNPTQFTKYIKTTVFQIGLLWIFSIALAALILHNQGNWVYFHPLQGKWSLACARLFSSSWNLYWGMFCVSCTSISLFLYLLCLCKLKQQRHQRRGSFSYKRNSWPYNKKAEKNLIAIGLTMTIVLLLENGFWRLSVQENWFHNRWVSFSVSFATLLRCCSTPTLILIVSSELLSNSVFTFCLRKNSLQQERMVNNSS
ncbi:hypothetical protein T4B_4423 [Trichinella pseudospiralis]|uniref:G-protein coupled receptors family 1 profile domain-containing protein n=2 Tax=Trichinella pseudospiralis TaxID=6337 RepID=A0A0V1EXW6_TRIPS|nr:hypothetical protein T4E_10546 [Trichinella pseudospiralis]KRY78523.1 hypothetical protein T4A_13874 [Trichinella pseudospiralis]KRY92436.1 hypothetical protein T4D_839 [Trichinella pseudospiralis]KRZ34740.1 hypothetical protein T4B_4423 [Trichinella pseudospiralis]KRZ45961.1 hypothetical protein T4C_6725 [Trichinella pseudospiralis]